jgi:hypothetical protein
VIHLDPEQSTICPLTATNPIHPHTQGKKPCKPYIE